MPAPATLGKLCTSLDQMQVGDYIKCVYEAPSENVAGDFSHLGDIEPKYQITSTVNITDESGAVVYEDDGVTPKTKQVTTEVAYPELPVTPGTTAKGFFYLIKVDKGLLVADRMVQQQISWEALNKKNYIYGGSSFADAAGGDVRIRLLSMKEFDEYLLNGDLNGSRTATAIILWHGTARTRIDSIHDRVSNVTHSYSDIMEWIEDNSTHNSRHTFMLGNNVVYLYCRLWTYDGGGRNSETTYSISSREYTAKNSVVTTINDDRTWIYDGVSRHLYTNYYRYSAFRPSLTFLDNPNSINQYF